jgi:hypothetical protein
MLVPAGPDVLDSYTLVEDRPMSPDQLDSIWSAIVKAIEARLDIPELQAFRAALELDEEMRRDVASEVAAEVMRVEP